MLEWQDSEGWSDLPSEPEPTRRRWPRRRWFLLLLVIVVVAIVAYLAQAPIRYRQLRADVQATADLELWAWQNRDPALFETLLDPQASPAWRQQHIQEFRLFPLRTSLVRRGTPQVEVETVDLQGDMALVTLRIRVPDFPTGPLNYTQALPYHYIDGRWARSAPDASLWGKTRRLTTPHFIFEYDDRDALAVNAVAVDVERFYSQLLSDLDLGKPGDEQWSIILTLDPPWAPAPAPPPGTARLQSPTLALMTPGMTPTRQLKLALGRWLGGALLHNDEWTLPLAGSTLWNLPVAVVEWNTLDWVDAGVAPGEAMRQPQRWQDLRQTFENMPATLSVMDYVQADYGHAAFLRLVGTARRGFQTWDDLLPAALGVSRPDFEAAWLRYLDTQLVRLRPPTS